MVNVKEDTVKLKEKLTSMADLCLFLLSWEDVLVGAKLLVEAEGYVELVLRADIGGVGLAGSVT